MEHIFFYDNNNNYDKIFFYRKNYLNRIKEIYSDFQENNERKSISIRTPEYNPTIHLDLNKYYFVCDFCNKTNFIQSIFRNETEKTTNIIYLLNTPKEHNIICFSCGSKINNIFNKESTNVVEETSIITLNKLYLFK